jgi:FMN phosphatase YigB (HAD superfamily)
MRTSGARAVFFDWENTLAVWGLPNQYCSRLSKLLRTVGLHYTSSDISSILDDIKKELCANTKDGVLAWYAALLHALGCRGWTEETLVSLQRNYALQDFILVPNALKTVKALRGNGVLVGIITNHSQLIRSQIIKLMGESLSSIIISDEIGVCKPSAEIFTHAARSLNVPPDECIHVGDDLHIDAIAAYKHGGFKTGVWLTTTWAQESPRYNRGFGIISSIEEIIDLIEK